MKKTFSFMLCLGLVLLISACGGKKAGEETAGAPAGVSPQPAKTESAPAAQGTPYDCRYFTMTLAADWEASPENMGMVNVLPKGKISPGLYFKFEGDGNAAGTAEASIETMIAKYDGSPMESAEIGGVEFKTTTYAFSGMTQTIYVAFREGTKITITIEGTEGKDNAAIKEMLASVRFK
jgi:hypothetical protein